MILILIFLGRKYTEDLDTNISRQGVYILNDSNPNISRPKCLILIFLGRTYTEDFNPNISRQDIY